MVAEFTTIPAGGTWFRRAAALVGALLLSTQLQAAGMATHAFMADLGRAHLDAGLLRDILTQNRASLLAGAMYPDGGYFTAQDAAPQEHFGDRGIAEHAHWGFWANHFIEYIRELGCMEGIAASPVPAELGGPPLNVIGLTDHCARLVAFMMGNAAHGMGDEVWDDLFEPQVREYDELPFHGAVVDASGDFGPFTPPAELRAVLGEVNYDHLAGAFGLLNNIEYGMDMIAIVEHNLYDDNPVLEFPPADDLQKVYEKAGLSYSRQAIEFAALATRGAMTAQRAGTAVEYPRIRMTMPWASAHYYTESGGVIHVSGMIAGMYRQLWNKLTGATAADGAPAASWIVGEHPSNGEVEVPYEYRLADQAVRAWLGNYVASSDPGSGEALQQPPVFISVRDEQGNAVAGSNDVNIYGDRGDGHGIRFHPNDGLRPGTRYIVTVHRSLVDDRGMNLPRAHSWHFTTASRPSALCEQVKLGTLHGGEMAQKCSRDAGPPPGPEPEPDPDSDRRPGRGPPDQAPGNGREIPAPR